MRSLVAAIITLLLFGGVAVGAYQAGFTAAGGSAATAATAAYPHWLFFPFGFLFPLLFLFLFFGLASAAFGRARSGAGYGRHWGGPRMWDEWHRELHERDKAGAEKAER